MWPSCGYSICGKNICEKFSQLHRTFRSNAKLPMVGKTCSSTVLLVGGESGDDVPSATTNVVVLVAAVVAANFVDAEDAAVDARVVDAVAVAMMDDLLHEIVAWEKTRI